MTIIQRPKLRLRPRKVLKVRPPLGTGRLGPARGSRQTPSSSPEHNGNNPSSAMDENEVVKRRRSCPVDKCPGQILARYHTKTWVQTEKEGCRKNAERAAPTVPIYVGRSQDNGEGREVGKSVCVCV